jgi:hypothetical protein
MGSNVDHGERESLRRSSGSLSSSLSLREGILTTGGVFATATYFSDVCLLSLLAVFATILAVGLGWAIARRMHALVFLIVCHKKVPYFLVSCRFILKLTNPAVKERPDS